MHTVENIRDFIIANLRLIIRLLQASVIIVLVVSYFLPELPAPLDDFVLPSPKFWHSSVLILLLEVLRSVHKAKIGEMRFFLDHEAWLDIGTYISQNEPRKAKIIHYSSHQISSTVLQALANLKKCDIQLLLQHPYPIEECKNDFVPSHQKDRIRGIISDMELNPLKNIEVRFYKTPASLRGVMLDKKYISIGWYTNEYHKGENGNVEIKLLGNSNPLIHTYTSTIYGTMLKKMFTRTFDSLWENSVTIDQVRSELKNHISNYASTSQ